MKLIKIVYLIFLSAIPALIQAVPTIHSNPTFNPNTDISAIQAQIMDLNVRYGHDTRLLYRAYSALVARYPTILGIACASQAPAGVNVFFTFKNPGYLNTPGSNEYCSVFFLPIVAEPIIGGGK